MSDLRSILFVLLVLVPAGVWLVGFLYMVGCMMRAETLDEEEMSRK
jgi:hypothetical protein